MPIWFWAIAVFALLAAGCIGYLMGIQDARNERRGAGERYYRFWG